MKTTCSLIFFFIFFSSSSILSQALVPLSKTFKYVNQGELFTNSAEYNAYYRHLPILNYPFILCFFNTTPDFFTLGLSMGTNPEAVQSADYKRWVWSANRARPVHENATLVFSRNGNLVLLDSNGRVAWQTKTANKGVVDIKLLPNGNLVLLNQKGQFVWQSFDYPTDTLLAGQSLHAKGGVNKLVSRASDSEDSNGPYSMVLDDLNLILYFKSKFSPKPLAYEHIGFGATNIGPFKTITFFVYPSPSDELGIGYIAMNRGEYIWAQPKYNSSLSMLRLGYDGNLHVFTYYEKDEASRWEETYTYFSVGGHPTSACELPEKCGAFGLCVNSQCVACPSPKGLLGWSDQCKPSKIPACGEKTKSNVGYYKMDGVHHFSRFSEGEPNMTVKQCQDKCSKDCKCVAFFHSKGFYTCLTTNELNTLTNSSDPTYIAYIKYAK